MTHRAMSCVVIIPAAGTGTRFGGDTPKQFITLRGKPLISWSIEKFLRNEAVARVIICVAQERRTEFERLVVSSGWRSVDVVPGGATRQESVFRGLVAASSGEAELVAVHDAVRPFFSTSTFHALLDAAKEHGAAVPVIPLADSIHRVADGVVVETADRWRWRAAQTPQCFRMKLLQEILDRARADRLEGTDEAGIAVRYGHRVRAVDGDSQNIKITRPEDFRIAEANFDVWEEQ